MSVHKDSNIVDDYIYNPKLSDTENQIKRFSQMDILSLDYLIKNCKNVYTDETYEIALNCYESRSSELDAVLSDLKSESKIFNNTCYNPPNSKNTLGIFFKKHKTKLFLLIVTLLITYLSCVGLYTLILGNAAEEKNITSAKADTSVSAEKTTSVSYVGSKNSDKYHLPNCKWAAKIKKSNKITFTSEAKAHAKGYSPCKTCID